MNANELADELTKMFRGEQYDRLIHEIPDMLRQQQAEIEALKSRIHDAIAWMDLKEWNSIDREILLEIFRGEEQEK